MALLTFKGGIHPDDGKELAKIETLHEGMGVFVYTPGSEPAVAKVTYREKEYTFDLPEALPTGYVLNVASSGGAIVGNLRCNAQTPAGDVAAFISREGRPYAYYVLPMTPGGEQTFLLKTKDLPGGIYQVSILNALGTTLCERFTFVQPNEKLSMQMAGMRDVYRPFEPVRCEIEVKDAEGKPLEGTFSVSIRDAVRSDYIENDHTLFTDMLLTSGLKGYIHQPGYYFTDITMRKLQELDALLMVHGWRQYDMSVLTASNPPELLQQPETDLILSGQYRGPIDFGEEILVQSKNGLTRMRNAKANLKHLIATGAGEMTDGEKSKLEALGRYREEFIQAMDDDLNTADAISAVFELITAINTHVKDGASKEFAQKCLDLLMELATVLGLLQQDAAQEVTEISPEIQALIDERQAARKEKNFVRADEIRDQLKAMGITLKDTPQGVQVIKE